MIREAGSWWVEVRLGSKRPVIVGLATGGVKRLSVESARKLAYAILLETEGLQDDPV